jgi:hypothetical protein
MMRASSLLVLFILVLGCLSCRPIILDVENAFPSNYFRMSHELFGKYYHITAGITVLSEKQAVLRTPCTVLLIII